MSILYFIFLLLVIVCIHEGGHLLAAKFFGVYCHEFSFGMGPLLFSKRGKETKYSIRAIPIGGYVSMAGDTENQLEEYCDVDVPSERTLTGIHPIKRIVIMYAGIFMNLILALVVMSMVLLSRGYTLVSPDAIIKEVKDDYPAYNAGIEVGDLIEEITLPDSSTYKITSFQDISMYISLYKGEGEISFKINRNSEIKEVDIKPIYDEENESYLIGITSDEYKKVDINLLNCFKYGFETLIGYTVSIISSLSNLIRGVGLKDVSGPIGIYQTTKEVASYGLASYLTLLAVISLNLGIMNALPLPALDGGRVLLTIIEMIIGKPINKKITDIIMTASVILLIGLMIYVSFNDVLRLF